MTPAAGARSRTATTLVALAALLLGTLVAVLTSHAPADGAEPPGPERRYAPGIDPALPADATVRGTVLGPNGELRDYVLVEAFSVVDPTGAPVASDLTYEVADVASHGAYTLHLPAGDYLVRFSSPEGTAPALEPAYYGGGPGTTVTVASGQDLVLDPVTLQRDQGVPVTGRVLDAGGRPMAGIEVWLVRVPSNLDVSVRETTWTAADGTFRFATVARERRFTIAAYGGYDIDDQPLGLPNTWLGGKPSYLTADTFTLGSRSGGHDLGDVVHRRGASVTGRLTTPTGPVESADVALIHLNADGDDGVVVAWDWVEDPDDSYEFSALPGRYTIGVLAYGTYETGDTVFLGDTPDLASSRTFTIGTSPYAVGPLTIGTGLSVVTFQVLDDFGQLADSHYQPSIVTRSGDHLAQPDFVDDGRYRFLVRHGREFTIRVVRWEDDAERYLGDVDWIGGATFLTASSDMPTLDAGSVSFALPAPTAPAPQVRGTARNGQVLTVEAPVWSLTEVASTFQWLRDGVAIPGTTSAAYLLGTADVGHRVSVRVTGSLWGHTPGVVTSKSALIAAGPAPSSLRPPTISGSSKPGGVLVASPAAWPTGAQPTGLQWYADGKRIPGATGTSLRLGYQHAGRLITVTSTARLAGYEPGTSTSRPLRVGRVVPLLRLTARGSSVRVQVTAPGGLPVTGRVVLYRGAKVVAKTVLTARQRGTTTIDLTRLGRGKHRISAWYGGTDTLASAGRTRPVTVRVTR